MAEPSEQPRARGTSKNVPADITILLLDSDPVMRAALRETLEHANYFVESAADLGEAVDRMDEIRPTLLITRPYINSMPGRTAANYLRTKCPGLTVLIVTGFLDDERITTQNAVEHFYTFPPPFRAHDLLVKVKDLLSAIRKRV
jgi:DNA-binding response OmpR family regulator